ncbi:hypothetical protein [Streptomyces pseudogriseolus]|uniref:hypothetical protein n=1 Tax=Streptomyces pseudogriseolus TaxID=36817 RepID=UPI003FA2B1A5
MNYLEPLINKNLRSFVRAWYGPPTSPNVTPTPSLTPELTEWHHISSQWDRGITTQNYAIPLCELAAKEGKVPFWVENQGSRLWAFDQTDKNRLVYEKDPSNRSNPWTSTGESLSTFLLHATVVEAIFGAPVMKVSQGVDVNWISSQAHEIPFVAWNWPTRDSRILASEEWLALVHPGDSKDECDLMVAATTPEHLEWVRGSGSVKWRTYVAPRPSTTSEDPPW